MTLAAGTKLGPYEIVSPLGVGGMGEVYKARDTRLGRDVAIKVLPERLASDPEYLRRFQNEARAVAALSHPNIMAIHDIGEQAGRFFAVTELLEGETLRGRLQHEPPSWRRAAELGAQAAEGLAVAHARGIVHRDFKPENVMITSDGQLKILDFGLARVIPRPAASDSASPTRELRTEPGTLLGTAGYMSPEQVRGDAVDSRGDIFALGCVMFEIATGKRAFHGASAAETMAEVLKSDPCQRLEVRAEIPENFVRIVARCLEKSPDDRFQSARDLAFALRLVSGEKATARPHPPTVPGHGLPTLAVLPFVNRSPDPENEYFSDGMTEELISALSRVDGLRVASRTSVFAVKGRGQDVRELGRELGVTAVVEGSVRRAGERLRVTAELTGVAEGFHLWSETYDRDIHDIFSVQDDISRRIVATLRDRLGIAAANPVPQRAGTNDVRAYQLYLKGRHFWARRTAESRKKAVELFEEAIEADPGFARAHSGLADCYLERGGFGTTAKVAMERARRAARRALELDDTLADAHTSLARVLLYFDWDWAAAEAEVRRAVELDPRYAEGRHTYSHYLLPAGRVAESLRESLAALEIDPLDLGFATHLGWHYLYSGDFDRAVQECRAAVELDPGFFYAHFYLGMAHEQKGDTHAAGREFDEAVRISPESAEAAAGWIRVQAAMGNDFEAQAALERLAGKSSTSAAYESAVAQLGLGQAVEAIASLERALDERSERMVDMAIDPRLRPLHDDPRFRAIARRVGIPAL